MPSWDISSEQSNILLNSSSQQNSARVENWIELTANEDFVESYVLAAVTERTVWGEAEFARMTANKRT